MFQNAKTEIKNVCNGKETIYSPVIEIVKKKVKDKLDTSLHLVAYILNSYYL